MSADLTAAADAAAHHLVNCGRVKCRWRQQAHRTHFLGPSSRLRLRVVGLIVIEALCALNLRVASTSADRVHHLLRKLVGVPKGAVLLAALLEVGVLFELQVHPQYGEEMVGDHPGQHSIWPQPAG